MSVNLEFVITIQTVPPKSVAGLIKALQGLMYTESLDRETFVDQTGPTPGRVQVYTTNPVIISGVGRWQPGFEERVKQLAGEHAPKATVKFEWTYPDDE